MTTATLERTMGRKKSDAPSSKPSNEGRLVRLDPSIVAMGKLVAASRGRHLSDYFSDLLRDVVGKEYAKMVRDLEKGGGK